MKRTHLTLDGNEAAARVAYRVSEVAGIYPITPASPMGELADHWATRGETNIWGAVPSVLAMQSEGGAAGALHGSLQAGALSTTFTASQGLLLMIPNLYKIAGELTSTVFHVAARSLAAQALSIFGDHSDVMAARATGWAQLFSSSVQEAMDLALVSHSATLEARVPFLHVFDGFRTSHEIQRIECLDDEDLRALIDDDLVQAHRRRALSPDHPVIRGTAQNPDVYFQAREAANPFYDAVPAIVQDRMDRLAARTGRQYHLFDYSGSPEAERVIVIMGSGAEAVEETVDHLVARGEKVGMLRVRLFRPFSVAHFLDALPQTVRHIAALDRTKEPGSAGEPLYQDVLTAVAEGERTGIRVCGGRYGLSSKEFNPGMIKGIFDALNTGSPPRHFTIGIHDDVSHLSLDWDPAFDIEPDSVTRAVFWGLGSDGTVGANKNTIKIIGEGTGLNAQGYFVYDSKKAGARTVSHLRFGPDPIRSTYLIGSANFVGVHQFSFLSKYDTLSLAAEGATLLLNAPYGPEEVWDRLPAPVRKVILEKKLRLFVIDAYRIARSLHLGMRINTVMQASFFALSDVLERGEAVARIEEAIRKTYGKRGPAVVDRNIEAVHAALEHLHEVRVPGGEEVVLVPGEDSLSPIPAHAPRFVREVTGPLLEGRGDELPVSAFPPDGTWPTDTAKWERRSIAQEVPAWEPDLCIQCGKCVLVCPHAVIRTKLCDSSDLTAAPSDFAHVSAKWRNLPDKRFTLQVAPEDCTGCTLCVEVCPARDKSNVGRKAINMVPKTEVLERQRRDWDYFLTLPETVRGNGTGFGFDTVREVQFLEPLFEYSGACAGCGETPYLKLMSQLFGDRSVIANATGCSSIYGGNLPTTPWSVNGEGRGPAWSNSLFEDNAEFGLGMRIALDCQTTFARLLVERLAAPLLGDERARGLLDADQSTPRGIEEQRARVAELKNLLANADSAEGKHLLSVADSLVKKSVWIVGGDGWAYDIGFGGLDHVFAGPYNVNILVLDTEVYSNTGGQASKSTPLGAVAKFASGGKGVAKKDLGRIAMDYGHVYVAQIAMGARDAQTVKAFHEAEAHDGPSLIIAYSQCIAHGIDMAEGMDQQKRAVDSGHWLLYRYNPSLRGEGKNPLTLDSKEPKLPLSDYMYRENRYRMLRQAHPDVAKVLLNRAEEHVRTRRKAFEALAAEPSESIES